MRNDTIAGRLRLLLDRIGMSQSELSRRSGLPYRSIQHYYLGNQKPGSDALIAIKRATGVSLDWLLTGGDEQVLVRDYAATTLLEARENFRRGLLPDLDSSVDAARLAFDELSRTRRVVAKLVSKIERQRADLVAGGGAGQRR
jgi:transcriptional regulator with XRE-family HTH domain